MKIIFLFLIFTPGSFNQSIDELKNPLSPFSDQWNNKKYLLCNTAAHVNYMTEKEKNTIYILNLLRSDPQLFVNTVLVSYPRYSGNLKLARLKEYKSLVETLRKLSPKQLLYPDSLCYVSARCHAASSGMKGYIGHDRQNSDCRKKKFFQGECCDYGHSELLDIIMSLLIDEGVPSLAHREICLGPYSKIGVSIQPHKIYRQNAVIDFVQ